MANLTDLPFTPKARARAVEYGHTAADYVDVEPGGAYEKYTIEQVQEVQAGKVADAEPESAPVAPEPAPVSVSANMEPIDAGTWRGHPNYGCPWCDFASLDESVTRNHIRRHGLGNQGVTPLAGEGVETYG